MRWKKYAILQQMLGALEKELMHGQTVNTGGWVIERRASLVSGTTLFTKNITQ